MSSRAPPTYGPDASARCPTKTVTKPRDAAARRAPKWSPQAAPNRAGHAESADAEHGRSDRQRGDVVPEREHQSDGRLNGEDGGKRPSPAYAVRDPPPQHSRCAPGHADDQEEVAGRLAAVAEVDRQPFLEEREEEQKGEAVEEVEKPEEPGMARPDDLAHVRPSQLCDHHVPVAVGPVALDDEGDRGHRPGWRRQRSTRRPASHRLLPRQ